MNGKLPLPQKQQWIGNMFRRYDYTHEVCFDHNDTIYLFSR